MAVIAWTCKPCGHHVEGVAEYIALDSNHACRVAEAIRNGVRYFRGRSPVSEPIADWLEACAGQADAMASPDDFAECDEPGSVKHALAVAQAIGRHDQHFPPSTPYPSGASA